jgi:hypothetical protein
MDPNPINPPEIAVRVGTVNAIDRSKQYTRADNAELKRSLDELWAQKRLLENAIRDRDKQIDELHSRVAQRDKLIAHQAGYLKTKDLKFWVLRFALGLLIAAQWGAIGWLAHELLARLH